jgi:bacterioferritin-associated ferredoxin
VPSRWCATPASVALPVALRVVAPVPEHAGPASGFSDPRRRRRPVSGPTRARPPARSRIASAIAVRSVAHIPCRNRAPCEDADRRAPLWDSGTRGAPRHRLSRWVRQRSDRSDYGVPSERPATPVVARFPRLTLGGLPGPGCASPGAHGHPRRSSGGIATPSDTSEACTRLIWSWIFDSKGGHRDPDGGTQCSKYRPKPELEPEARKTACHPEIQPPRPTSGPFSAQPFWLLPPLADAEAVYVCLCNALTDTEVMRVVQKGTCRPREVYAACGCRAQCGGCTKTILGAIRDRPPAVPCAHPNQ